jgi:tetratricopeptide (TPR) repeat protein
MAKTKPSKAKPAKSPLSQVHPAPKPRTPEDPTTLLQKAKAALETGDIEASLAPATRALNILLPSDPSAEQLVPALSLLGEIHVELGDIDSAQQFFLKAVELDEDGEVDDEFVGAAERFLWLAQLCEEGGQESIDWFTRGVEVLRDQIARLVEGVQGRQSQNGGLVAKQLEEKRRKLATALCGMVEVYMTDLSWEEDAEQKCEALVTEATLVAPEFAEPWQTLANVRLSQTRVEDAQAALKRSLEIWKDLEPGDEQVPDYPSRVSLARLLMEAEMEEEAIEVLERLVGEDDTAVEVWYLGGWALYVMGEKQKTAAGEKDESYKVSWISSRRWLNQSMKLFVQQEYEDDRLGEHAKELINILDKDLGGPAADDEDWEDDGEEDDQDEEMADS